LGQHKKVADFPFASCQKHLLDENAEKASEPDKNGKSMRRKVETVSLFFICRKKGRKPDRWEGELKISRDEILITLGTSLTTIYNNFINFLFLAIFINNDFEHN
jgi:hypothetical protein